MSNQSTVFDELIELKTKFDKVMDKLSLTDVDVSVISMEYGQLKTLVKNRLDELQLVSALTSEQQQYLLPALKEVQLYCTAKSNTKNRQDLASSLCDAQDYLGHYLSQKV